MRVHASSKPSTAKGSSRKVEVSGRLDVHRLSISLPVSSVACGGSHTLAVLGTTGMLGWGANNSMQVWHKVVETPQQASRGLQPNYSKHSTQYTVHTVHSSDFRTLPQIQYPASHAIKLLHSACNLAFACYSACSSGSACNPANIVSAFCMQFTCCMLFCMQLSFCMHSSFCLQFSFCMQSSKDVLCNVLYCVNH
jgi:hypothetical protein